MSSLAHTADVEPTTIERGWHGPVRARVREGRTESTRDYAAFRRYPGDRIAFECDDGTVREHVSAAVLSMQYVKRRPR